MEFFALMKDDHPYKYDVSLQELRALQHSVRLAASINATELLATKCKVYPVDSRAICNFISVNSGHKKHS